MRHSTLNSLIEIEKCYIRSNSLLVYYDNGQGLQQIKLYRPDFTSWLYRTSRWVVGYFNCAVDIFHRDLADYLLSEKQGEVLPESDMKDILSDYSE